MLTAGRAARGCGQNSSGDERAWLLPLPCAERHRGTAAARMLLWTPGTWQLRLPPNHLTASFP